MIGITLKPSNAEPPLPPQVINYQMLYYLGDECTDVTGGWDGTFSTSGPTLAKLNKNTNNIGGSYTKSSTGAGALCYRRTTNKIDVTDFTRYVVFTTSASISAYANTMLYDQSTIWDSTTNLYRGVITTSATPKAHIQNIESVPKNITYYISFQLGFDGAQTGTSSVYTSATALFKNDDISGLSAYGADIASIIANASLLLADVSAVKYMVSQCTGDFMASAIADSGFITALNASDNKNLVLANEHWAKFLALVA